jgi:hypothetical protein
MRFTNKLGLPDAIVNAVANDPYVGGGDISVTALVAPPQIRILRQKHDADIVVDVSERLWSLYGQAIHYILERAGVGAREQRLYMDVSGWQLSGQFDLYNPDGGGLLQDYKLTSAWTALRGPKAEWTAQLNCLAELARVNNMAVDRLEVVALYRDWSRTQAKRSFEYPRHPASTVPIPLWERAMAQRFIETRVAFHQEAERGNVRPCSDDERWYTGGAFAVMKKGRQSAVRVLPSREDAEKFVAKQKENGGLEIVERRGVYLRCENYCDVAEFCPQFGGSQGGAIG